MTFAFVTGPTSDARDGEAGVMVIKTDGDCVGSADGVSINVRDSDSEAEFEGATEGVSENDGLTVSVGLR